MTKRVMVGIATTAVVLLASLAGAHERTVFDADDSPGPLDVAAARHRHQVQAESVEPQAEPRRIKVLSFNVRTYERWRSRLLSGVKNFISVEFNLDRDPRIERCMVVTNTTDGLIARMYRQCIYFDDPLVGAGNATRPNRYSVRISFRKRLLGPGIRVYAWRAISSYQDAEPGGSCPPPEPHGDGGYGSCSDPARWVRHRR